MGQKTSPEYLREKWRKYAEERDSIIMDGQNMIIVFRDNTRSVLKFIGEFTVEKNRDFFNNVDNMTISEYIRDAPDSCTIRAYRNSSGGEIIATIVDNENINKKSVYNYFESSAEMGKMFGSNFRYVLVEKTLPTERRIALSLINQDINQDNVSR